VEGATRDLDDEILITEDTRALLGDTIELARRGLVTLRGKPDPVRVWAPVVESPGETVVDPLVDTPAEPLPREEAPPAGGDASPFRQLPG
jgi:hypothetical protein